MVVSFGFSEYPWIADTEPVMGQRDADRFDGHVVARRLLTEGFSIIPPPPPYDEDGIYRQALAPLGQIGEYWFFESDPDAFYAIPFGEMVMIDPEIGRVAADRFEKTGAVVSDKVFSADSNILVDFMKRCARRHIE